MLLQVGRVNSTYVRRWMSIKVSTLESCSKTHIRTAKFGSPLNWDVHPRPNVAQVIGRRFKEYVNFRIVRPNKTVLDRLQVLDYMPAMAVNKQK